MSDKQQFLAACDECQQKAAATGRKWYVVRQGQAFAVTSETTERWLLMAYPGGRGVLSQHGSSLLSRSHEALEPVNIKDWAVETVCKVARENRIE